MKISPFAGQLPGPQDLVDVSKLLYAYEHDQPDPSIASQQVHFGTSGHRGSSFDLAFNKNHILAMTQAICLYRKKNHITGPLFLGFDTHALSLPAFQTALEVIAANEITTLIAENQEFTPTPVISHSILCYNKDRKEGFADGIIITPSHNPPREGGFKYNPPHGGPAEKEITDWIENCANEILMSQLKGVLKIPYERSTKAATTKEYDFLNFYVRDLEHVIDMDIIRDSKIRIGVDPLGGAGVHYWGPIADFYKLNLSVVNTKVDPCFRFMTRDWDGQIRMDPSSSYAMQSLIREASKYDISFGCDTDHDRHGIVSKDFGLIPANNYLSVSAYYLFKHRHQWHKTLKVGKTVVSSQMIDRVAHKLDRKVYEVPVGFKWFVEGLSQKYLGFAGEESAGSTFLRKNGDVWTTDKDAFVPSLLAAEMTARLGHDPAVIYKELTQTLGTPYYSRVEAPATLKQRETFKTFSPHKNAAETLGGDKVEDVLTQASGNNDPIGGFKVITKNGWIAARPSGTEDIYKIYAESFVSEAHLNQLIQDAQNRVNKMFATPKS